MCFELRIVVPIANDMHIGFQKSEYYFHFTMLAKGKKLF